MSERNLAALHFTITISQDATCCHLFLNIRDLFDASFCLCVNLYICWHVKICLLTLCLVDCHNGKYAFNNANCVTHASD